MGYPETTVESARSADESRALFGQTMGLFAVTAGLFALGAYLGRAWWRERKGRAAAAG